MLNKSCAFTGHRPARFRFGYDEDSKDCFALKRALALQIENMAAYGSVTTFYTGMALGVDTWAAEIVLNLKDAWPGVKLVAVLPCETQPDRWAAQQRQRYFGILARCDEVETLHTQFTPTCMMERNRWLVDHAGTLLAIYDGGPKGGTAYTVRYAREMGRSIVIINPDTLKVSTSEDFAAIERRRQSRVSNGSDCSKK